MQLDGLDNLLADLCGRVHAGHRVLENHSDFLAANFLHFFFAGLHDVVPGQIDAAFDDARRGHRVELHNRLRGHGLAAAALADNRQHLALVHVQRHAADSLDLARIGVKRHMQVFHIQNSLCHAAYLLRRGSNASRRPSPNMLNASIVRLMQIAGMMSWYG